MLGLGVVKVRCVSMGLPVARGDNGRVKNQGWSLMKVIPGGDVSVQDCSYRESPVSPRQIGDLACSPPAKIGTWKGGGFLSPNL